MMLTVGILISAWVHGSQRPGSPLLFLCFTKGEFSRSPGREGRAAEPGAAGGWGHPPGPAAHPALAQTLCKPAGTGQDARGPRFCHLLFQHPFCLALLFSIFSLSACSPEGEPCGVGTISDGQQKKALHHLVPHQCGDLLIHSFEAHCGRTYTSIYFYSYSHRLWVVPFSSSHFTSAVVKHLKAAGHIWEICPTRSQEVITLLQLLNNNEINY